MGDTGLELPHKSKWETGGQRSGGAKSGAHSVAQVPGGIPTAREWELATVIAVWPALAEPFRRAILAIVGSAAGIETSAASIAVDERTQRDCRGTPGPLGTQAPDRPGRSAESLEIREPRC